MKKLALVISMALLAVTAAHSSSVTESIDRYKAVFDALPVNTPTAKTADAPLAGNGDIGLTMCSTADRVRFFIGKNDFWKSYNSYPRTGIALPGWFDLSCKEIREGEYYAEQLPGSACIKASYATQDNCLSIKAWVAATDNKVIIDITTFEPTVLQFGLHSTDENGATVRAGSSDGVSWVQRDFKWMDTLSWPTYIALALNHEGNQVKINPGRHIFVISVYSNFDTPDYLNEAMKKAAEADQKVVDALWEEHKGWWEDFWGLSHVSIGDEFIEKYYYLSQYLFACSSREGKFAPGLWGPFITCDDTAWSGDYHLNYNYQSPYWGCYSSNQICLTENYDKPVLDYMEKGGWLASELLGCRGVYYPVGIGPFGLTTSAWPKNVDEMQRRYGTTDFEHDAGMMFWGQKSNASFCAINMMMRFYGTWDKEYARKVYPFVKACADFWEDWLVLEDGRYVDRNDDFHEERSWDGHKGDVNPTCSLGLIRMVLKGADDMSRLLGVDRQCRRKWKDILDKLSDFPTWEMPDGRVTLIDSETSGENGEKTYLDYRVGFNRIMMHGILIPPGVCGPHLTPEINDIMLSDVAQWEKRYSSEKMDWGNSLGNGIETVYPGAARIGFPAEQILARLKERIQMQSFPNGYIEAWGGGVETLAAVPFTVNEMLLQSFEGIVRVFPNWTGADASFSTLRADGAFLVSASMNGGEVGTVTILSEQGRPLTLENPWSGCKVTVSKNGKKPRTMSGDMLKIRTKPGQTLEINRK